MKLKDKKYIINNLGREPNPLEEAILEAMYCEHCGYRHSKNYLKIFKTDGENAGHIIIGNHAIIFKTESHNHPCAVEPYNGSATGVGGIIRDVLAMNARPIALCDSLKFEKFDITAQEVVRGISEYANCIGVPTVSGELHYHDIFKYNPIVNICAIGICKKDKIVTSKTDTGKLVVLLGNPTRKDGLGGATFASNELENNETSNRLSIQIADAFAKKKLIEATLEIFSKKIANSCQDCGAAGILSSTSEIAYKSDCAIELYLDKVHIGQKGISPSEIMLSETQERMIFTVDEKNIKKFKKIAQKYQLEFSIIGKTLNGNRYKLFYNQHLIADLPVKLLVNAPFINAKTQKHKNKKLKKQPDAERKWVYNQYDWSVGARTLFEPDNFNAIWIYEENCYLGIVTASDFYQCNKNPFNGAYTLVKECMQTLKKKGFKPLGLTNCLNFASPEDPEVLFDFVQTIKGLNQASKEFKIPVLSGNVSFYNECNGEKIPPLPVITMLGVKYL